MSHRDETGENNILGARAIIAVRITLRRGEMTHQPTLRECTEL